MSMLNVCQDDLATWQKRIAFEKARFEPEQGSMEKKSHRSYVEPIQTWEENHQSYDWAAI